MFGGFIKNNVNIIIVFTYAFILYAFDIKDNYPLLLALTMVTIIGVNKYYIKTVETMDNKKKQGNSGKQDNKKTQGLPAWKNERDRIIIGMEDSKIPQAPFNSVHQSDRDSEIYNREYKRRSSKYSFETVPSPEDQELSKEGMKARDIALAKQEKFKSPSETRWAVKINDTPEDEGGDVEGFSDNTADQNPSSTPETNTGANSNEDS